MNDTEVRRQLVAGLRGGRAFMTFADAVADFPQDMMNTSAPNVTYTFWHLLEHIRITQWDILDFSRNPQYREIAWPKDYWPAKNTLATVAQWDDTIRQTGRDTQAMIDLVRDESNDLYAPFPWGQGQNLLREAMLVSEHNAYHVGEFAILRQVMNAWPQGHR